MVEVVHLLRDPRRDAGCLLQILQARVADRAAGAEMHQQRLFPRGADAGDLVERARADRLAALVAVDADREAVDLVA